MKIQTQPKLLRRTVATIIDYGLYFIFFTWLVVTYGQPNDEGGYTLTDEPESWWIPIGWIIYFPVVESFRGQTLGKMILGLRVVTKSGNPISFGQACKRHLVDMLDFMFFGIVAFIAIKNTPDHQRLGDLLAKTIVIGGDDYYCSNCHDQLTLTADEIIKREFVCPTCRKKVKISQAQTYQTE